MISTFARQIVKLHMDLLMFTNIFHSLFFFFLPPLTGFYQFILLVAQHENFLTPLHSMKLLSLWQHNAGLGSDVYLSSHWLDIRN
jgi:hypothetical protein